MTDIPDELVEKAAEAIWMRSDENRDKESWKYEAEIALDTVLPDMWGKIREEYMWKEATALKQLERVRALADEPCENYDAPGQDCITAGPEVFAVEACCRCRVRAALEGEPDD